MDSTVRIAYAANRRIGLSCLRKLLAAGVRPVVLLVPEGDNAECTAEMEALLPDVPVLRGKAFSLPENLELLTSLKLDYLLSIHFPLILPKTILATASHGALNLHPAYLPWNRGWHTPSWAILEGTPYGATLHWIDEGLDTGPIALQKKVEVHADDTAHVLYQRALAAEGEIFAEAIPQLQTHSLPRVPQSGKGTSHAKADLEKMRKLDASLSPEEKKLRIRALTTNNPGEAAYE